MKAIALFTCESNGLQIKKGEIHEVHNPGTSCEIILVDGKFLCYTDSDYFNNHFKMLDEQSVKTVEQGGERMKAKYQTVYEVSYGILNSVFKEQMTFEEAEKLGKEYCEENGFRYINTERVSA